MSAESLKIIFVTNVIRKALKPLTRDFGEIMYLQSSPKGTSVFAAKSYTKIEQIIVTELQASKYNYPICNVDSKEHEDAEYRWIIAPISGIKNFEHALPFFGICIALQKLISGKHETVAAIFSKGKIRMRVSCRESSDELLLSSNNIFKNSCSFGCELLEMILVASGKLEAIAFANMNLNEASIGKLFIEESGGCLLIKDGRVTASNNAIAKTLKIS